MSFYDLPSDWPDRPLSDPEIAADVLDLVVTDSDRRAGGVCLLLCREGDRLAQPVFVSGAESRAYDHFPEELFIPFVDVVERTLPGGGLVVALARRYGQRPTDGDRDWHQAAIDTCRDRVRLIGAYIVTVDGVVRLPDEPLVLDRAG